MTEFEFVLRHIDRTPADEWAKVARACRIPLSTFKKIGYRYQSARGPSTITVGTIAKYFRVNPSRAGRRLGRRKPRRNGNGSA